MNVTINRAEMLSAIKRASAIAPADSPLDVLRGVLLEADAAAGKLTVTSTNLEAALEEKLPCMEGGCLDEFDIRELLKHDQPFRDMWDAVGSDARIAVQQYRFRGGKQGEELGDENHFALMRAYDRALSDEDGSTFVERDDVDWLDDFELTKDDLADGK